LSNFPSSFANALRDLIGVAVLYGIVYVLLTGALELCRSRVCFSEVIGKAAGISGFDFEITDTDCWHSSDFSVVVSRTGQSKKATLITYNTRDNPIPAIRSLDERTVQISLRGVHAIMCRTNEWDTLTIKYAIGFVDYPRSGTDPEC